MPFANLLAWPWTNSLLNAESCIFMRRGRCFSPPVSPVVLLRLCSVLLDAAAGRAPGGLQLCTLRVEEDTSRAKKVQRRAIKSCRTPRLGGKRCLASRRGDGEQPSDRCRAAIGRGWCRVTSRHVYLGCSKGDLSVVVGKSSQVFYG